MEFKIGDKVIFNEKTREKYQEWLNDKYNCGRKKFCDELKQCGGLDTVFTITNINYENIGRKTCVFLSPMNDWYFDIDEITFVFNK